MKKFAIKSKYLKAKFGDAIDSGFVSVPNVLTDYGHMIGLSDKACWFIVQILRAKDRHRGKGHEFIKDTDLNVESSRTTLWRIRKELNELKTPDNQPLIATESIYFKSETGKDISSVGTLYDFTKLFDYLFAVEKAMFQIETLENSAMSQIETPGPDMEPNPGNNDNNCGACFKLEHIILELKNYKNFKNDHFNYKKIVSVLNANIEADPGCSISFKNNIIYINHAFPDHFSWVELLKISGIDGEVKIVF